MIDAANADTARVLEEAVDANKSQALVAKEIVFGLGDDALVEHFAYVVEQMRSRVAQGQRTARMVADAFEKLKSR